MFNKVNLPNSAIYDPTPHTDSILCENLINFDVPQLIYDDFLVYFESEMFSEHPK